MDLFFPAYALSSKQIRYFKKSFSWRWKTCMRKYVEHGINSCLASRFRINVSKLGKPRWHDTSTHPKIMDTLVFQVQSNPNSRIYHTQTNCVLVDP